MRLAFVAFAAIGVTVVAASEVQQPELSSSSSNTARGVRGSYVNDEIGIAADRDEKLKEDEFYWNRLLQDTDMSVTKTPTPAPTPAILTPPPTPTPIIPTVSPPSPSPSRVLDVILPVAKEGGAEFDDPNSYQSQALSWLEGNANVDSYSDEQIIQRYGLASIYYSTFAVSTPATDTFLGAGVTPNGWTKSDGWVTDAEECTWFGIGCEGGNVVSITLGNNFLTGTFACEVTLMNDTLTTLDIFRNPVYNNGDEGHDMFTMLPNLRFLMLQETNFRYAGLPPQLGSLNSLVELDVSNTLYGGGPLRGQVFANMPNLRYLDVSKNDFSSPVPAEIGNLPVLEKFYAVDSGITGDLSFLEPMPAIKEMWLDLNPNLGGAIPDFIGSKITLESLGLSSSGFTDALPASMGQLVNMKSLWLYNNAFSGVIPPEFGNMASLELLQLQMNDIGGSMPQQVCDLRPPGGVLNSLVADCVSEVSCAETCCTACF